MSQGGANNQGGSGAAGIETLTGNSGGAVGPDGAFNVNVLGSGTTTVVGTPGSSTLTVTPSSAGYPITPYVVGPVGKAGYQTIQSALDAANSAGGGDVYIQPGSYTENLILYDSVDLYGTPAISQNTGSSVTITGIHTPPLTGSVGFNSICFISTSDVIKNASAGSTHLKFLNCESGVEDGYFLNLPLWTGTFEFFDHNSSTTAAPFSVNDGGINNSGGASLFAVTSEIGSGTKTCTLSGTLTAKKVKFGCAVSFSDSSLDVLWCDFSGTITCSGSLTGFICFSNINTGASAALILNDTGVLTLANNVIDSSHAPAIEGDVTATLELINTSFLGNGNISSNLNTTKGKIRGNNSITRFVVGEGVDATYTSIQDAIDDAHGEGGGIVWVKAGSYVVDLTLYDNIVLIGDSILETFIFGAHTLPNSGQITFSNITFQATNDVFPSSAAGTTNIFCNNINFIITSGHAFDITNWTGSIVGINLQSASTNDGFINNTAGANLVLISSSVGSGSSQTMNVSGSTILKSSIINCPLNLQGSGSFQIENSNFNSPVTISSNATGFLKNGSISSGSSASLTMSSAMNVTLSNMVLESSNNPCIDGAGAGTLLLGTVTYLNDQNVSASLTLDHSNLMEGGKIFADQVVLGKRSPSLALDFSVQKTAASTLGIRIQNDSNDSAAGCEQILVGQVGGGDVWTTYQISIGGVFSQGIDNSDNDSFKMTNNTTVSIADTILKMTADGEQTLPLQPAFLATHSLTQTNVTGNGTVATCNYTTEVFDQGGNYDGTNTFTAPVQGIYRFGGSMAVGGLDATSTSGDIRIITSNRNYVFLSSNVGVIRNTSAYVDLMGIIEAADMDAADTCVIKSSVNGMGGDTVDFLSSVSEGTFSGGLIA